VNGLSDDALQARRECYRVFLTHVAREDRELVASEPCGDVTGPELRGDALPEHDEQFIAGAVAEAVVDRLEPVAVEKQYGEAARRVPSGGVDGGCQLLEEVGALGRLVRSS